MTRKVEITPELRRLIEACAQEAANNKVVRELRKRNFTQRSSEPNQGRWRVDTSFLQEHGGSFEQI